MPPAKLFSVVSRLEGRSTSTPLSRKPNGSSRKIGNRRRRRDLHAEGAQTRKHIRRVVSKGTTTPAGRLLCSSGFVSRRWRAPFRFGLGVLRSRWRVCCRYSAGCHLLRVRQDAKWVGKIIDFVPYESGGDKLTLPELEVVEGQPVEVIVTLVQRKCRFANSRVSFRREHDTHGTKMVKREAGVAARLVGYDRRIGKGHHADASGRAEGFDLHAALAN